MEKQDKPKSKTCGNIDDIFTVMAGSKMFIATTTRVKDFLEAIKLMQSGKRSQAFL